MRDAGSLTNRKRYWGFGEAPVPGETPDGGVCVTPLLPSPGVIPACVLTCVVEPLEVTPGDVCPPVGLPPLVLEEALPDVAVPCPLMPAPPVLLTLRDGVELSPPEALPPVWPGVVAGAAVCA
jgi:hypothetical protein